MNEIDLAWLAGFWDGEGTISLYRSVWKKRKNPLRRLKNQQIGEPERYRALMCLTNTHEPTMERAHAMLLEMGAKHYFYQKQHYRGHLGKRPMMQLFVMSHVSAARLLSHLRPYLFTKHEQAEALWRWIEIAATRDKQLPYNDEQRAIATFLRQRAAQGNPQPSSTGPATGRVVEKVQRLAGETPNDTPAPAPRPEQIPLW